ncbi:MAG: amidohydrolase, partial [Mesorhizobium sp.]
MSNPEDSAIAAPISIDGGILDRMIEVRRHLHRHPELSNSEAATQSYLREMLAGSG